MASTCSTNCAAPVSCVGMYGFCRGVAAVGGERRLDAVAPAGVDDHDGGVGGAGDLQVGRIRSTAGCVLHLTELELRAGGHKRAAFYLNSAARRSSY